ncbi:MAG: hypothetical protein ABSB78_02365 [Bacteroidota bacterium]
MIIRLFDIKTQLGIKGNYLLTRPIARQFVQSIHLIIEQQSKNDEPIEFSYEGIQSADTSFIDELIVINILEKMKKKILSHRGILFSHLTPSTLENARSVFLVKKIPITVKESDDKEQLIGHLEQNLKKVLHLLWEKKELKTVDLTKRLHVTKSVASTKLSALYNKHLALRKEEITAKGREYTYFSL